MLPALTVITPIRSDRKAHTMGLVAGGYQLTLPATRTGAYRLTARWRLTTDAPGTYRYYTDPFRSEGAHDGFGRRRVSAHAAGHQDRRLSAHRALAADHGCSRHLPLLHRSVQIGRRTRWVWSPAGISSRCRPPGPAPIGSPRAGG